MLRSILITAAFLGLFLPSSYPSQFLGLLPLAEEQHSSALTILKWLCTLCMIYELNSLLNRWAEKRWQWKDYKSDWDWKNEVAIVTGGSGGIGAELVKKLVSYGIKVAIFDIIPLSEGLRSDSSGLVHYYQCDITSRQAVQEAGKAVRAELGSPSILINNAGIGNAGSILDISSERLKAAFDVNIISHWNTVQEFLPDMIARKKGHILGTASLAAFLGIAGMVDYSCTKAALMAFHEGLTQELKHRYMCPQIKTSIVYPNWTRTGFIQAVEPGIRRLRAPIMDPAYVAEVMANQIIAAKSGQVIIGPRLAASVRALPIWLQEVVRDRLAKVVTVNATTVAA